MACKHLISTWIYSLPSCMYDMHASYLHMDILTTIMCVWHACILFPQGHTHYHHVLISTCKPHVCMACMHLISTWTIPTTIMYVWHACILSPHGHTHYHHVCKVCMHLISTWTYSLPSCMYGMHILSPQGHTHYHHVCMVCMHLISTWIYSLPSCM